MSVEDSWYQVDRATGRKVATRRHGRGKRWRVRNRGARTVSFDKRSDADAHDTTVKADLLKGVSPVDRKAARVLFADYARLWLAEHHYSPRGRATVGSRLETHLIPAFGGKRVCDIRTSTVVSWLAEMREKRSKRSGGQPLAESTVTVNYTLLVSIMRSAAVDFGIPNPCEAVQRPQPGSRRVVDFWEQDTVDALLAGMSDRRHAIPLLAATCGHRQGEAFAVAVRDVNFLRKEITIRHQVQRIDGALVMVPAKRGKVRTVPLPAVTSAALAAHIERYGTTTVRCTCCGADHEVLFTHRGQLVSSRNWDREWHVAVKAAGMTPSPATGVHQLRHYYASMLIDGGASMQQVKEYMGHSSIKITADVYGHLFERSHDKARAVVDAAFANSARRLPSSGSAGAYPLRTAQDQ